MGSREVHNLMFTQGEAAKLIGVNKSTFTRWDVPFKKEKNRKVYYGPELLEHEQVLTVLLKRNTKSASELEAARIEQTKALTSKLKIETKQKTLDFKLKKAEVIPAKDVEYILDALVYAARAKFLNMGRKVSTAVIGLTEESEIQEIVDELVNEALSELARGGDDITRDET